MLMNDVASIAARWQNRVPHELFMAILFRPLEPHDQSSNVRSHLSPAGIRFRAHVSPAFSSALRPSVIAKKRRNKDIDQVHEDLKVHTHTHKAMGTN